ncbi:hypothetical protein [Methylomonas sp. MgM2]
MITKSNIPLLTASVLLGITSFNVEASLTVGTSFGESVVYSSVSDVTWTGDANLLGTMITNHGYDTVINAIIAASPVIYDTPNFYDIPSNSGQHIVSSADFSDSILGRASWFGGMAFVDYLNDINYAGSSQWVLPNAGDNPQRGDGDNTVFGKLFYNELGATTVESIPDTNLFTNEQAWGYWFSTEYASSPISAWNFVTDEGGTKLRDYQKIYTNYVWAISPGQLAAVPVPGAAWLFGSGLIGLFGLKRRHHLNLG